MDKNDPLARAIGLGVSGASLSAGIVLQLWRQGLLPDDAREDFEKKLRRMAQDFEAAGADTAASQIWTAANLLRKQPPKSPE